MDLQIINYTPDWSPAVVALNKRLVAGGMNPTLIFPEEPRAEFPTDPNAAIHQEFFLAVEGDIVRGGYFMTHETWLIHGQPHRVSHYRLPLSESVIDRQYTYVSKAVMNHGLKRLPYVYCLGMGSYDLFPKRLAVLKWPMFSAAFLFHARRPAKVLRNLRSVRKNARKRLLLDLASYTGAGTIGMGLLQTIRHQSAPRTTVDVVPEFGPWADELLDRMKTVYPLLQRRGSEALNTRYPQSDARYIRLRIGDGWAVMLDTQMKDHLHFGDLRVGTIVDTFGPLEQARTIVQAAARHLADRGVDLIISNQTHATWVDAFAQSGFLSGPSNYIFACTPQLAETLNGPFEQTQKTLHITRGDGAGPIHL